VTVSYGATGGTATAGQDYTVNGTGTLTFGPGVTTQSFTVALTDDTRAEAGETIALALSAPVGATLDTPAVATVSVTSNDVAGTVQLASATYSASEGSGAAIITLVRQGGLASAVTVDVATLDGSALAGTHYTAVETTVTFAAGQTTATLLVPLVDDGAASEGRWLGLELGQPGGGAALGVLRSAVVWIVDDD
jgi:hypothetical protein